MKSIEKFKFLNRNMNIDVFNVVFKTILNKFVNKPPPPKPPHFVMKFKFKFNAMKLMILIENEFKFKLQDTQTRTRSIFNFNFFSGTFCSTGGGGAP